MGLKPVLSLWALVLFGLAFVGPTAPYTFFGVGAVASRGHFALVYLVAMVAVSFTATSYGKMAKAFPEAGSTYAYASKVMVENMLARDAEEGISAFIEKREAKWQDR